MFCFVQCLRKVFLNSQCLLFVFTIFVCDRAFSESITAENLKGKYRGYNVIIILIDALPQKQLYSYGHGRNATPWITRLSERSIVFDNAYAPASYTMPSIVSLFTSEYPYTHRILHVFKDKVPESTQTLAETLRALGYDTAWFGSCRDPHTGAVQGLLQGFDTLGDIGSQEVLKNSAAGAAHGVLRTAYLMERYDAVIKWVFEHKKSPFFIVVHSYAAHERVFPFMGYSRYCSLFRRKLLRGIGLKEMVKKTWEYLSDTYQNDPQRIYDVLGTQNVEQHKDLFQTPYTTQKFFHIKRLCLSLQQKAALNTLMTKAYHRELCGFDKKQRTALLDVLDSALFEVDRKLIGRLYRQLRREHLLDKTIILLTSAHGNEYGEHDEYGHEIALYQETIKIPFILYLPATISRRSDDIATLVDVLPTVLELIGERVPAEAQGKSLVERVERKDDCSTNDFTVSQTCGGLFSIVTPTWKLIDRSQEIPIAGKYYCHGNFQGREEKKAVSSTCSTKDKYELFFLKEDPDERFNRAAEESEHVERLKGLLDTWKKNLPISVSEEGFFEEVSEETRQRIRQTGYW